MYPIKQGSNCSPLIIRRERDHEHPVHDPVLFWLSRANNCSFNCYLFKYEIMFVGEDSIVEFRIENFFEWRNWLKGITKRFSEEFIAIISKGCAVLKDFCYYDHFAWAWDERGNFLAQLAMFMCELEMNFEWHSKQSAVYLSQFEIRNFPNDHRLSRFRQTFDMIYFTTFYGRQISESFFMNASKSWNWIHTEVNLYDKSSELFVTATDIW